MNPSLNQLEAIARKKFPAAEFVDAGEVCVFAEHETVDSEGNPVRFSRCDLVEIVDRCNARILDTGDFAPLTDGHNPSAENIASGAKEPEVLGYDGPFRLGVIGEANPRSAIFAREWHYKDRHEIVKRKPRRSVEYWTSKRHFDPIAALGATTPRLDIGMKLARETSEGERICYMAAAPSVDSQRHSANCSKPLLYQQFTSAKSRKQLSTDELLPQSKETLSMENAQMREFIAALDSLDWVQWVKGQMNTNATTLSNDESEVRRHESNVGSESTSEDDTAAADLIPASTEPQSEQQAKQQGVQSYRRQALQNAEKYAAVQKQNEVLAEKYAALTNSVTSLLRDKADAERERKISELAERYAFDVESLRKKALYSRGSEMTDDVFAVHVDTVEQYGNPTPPMNTLIGTGAPIGGSHRTPFDSEEAKVEAAIKYSDLERAKGNRIDFSQAMAHVENLYS